MAHIGRCYWSLWPDTPRVRRTPWGILNGFLADSAVLSDRNADVFADKERHIVIHIDTATLLNAYAAGAEPASYNTGRAGRKEMTMPRSPAAWCRTRAARPAAINSTRLVCPTPRREIAAEYRSITRKVRGTVQTPSCAPQTTPALVLMRPAPTMGNAANSRPVDRQAAHRSRPRRPTPT